MHADDNLEPQRAESAKSAGTEIDSRRGRAPKTSHPLSAQVLSNIRASKAENTIRRCSADWRDFCAWCNALRVPSIPAGADTVAAYIANCADRLKPGSIQRRRNAIAEAHEAAGCQSQQTPASYATR